MTFKGHAHAAAVMFTQAKPSAHTGQAHTDQAHTGQAHSGQSHTSQHTCQARTDQVHKASPQCTGLAHTGQARTGLAHINNFTPIWPRCVVSMILLCQHTRRAFIFKAAQLLDCL